MMMTKEMLYLTFQRLIFGSHFWLMIFLGFVIDLLFLYDQALQWCG